MAALNRFSRAYFGCTEDDVTTDTCKPHKAHIDRKAYIAAKESAKKLFDLKD